jgi:OOP family OmpA-OmpF porin
MKVRWVMAALAAFGLLAASAGQASAQNVNDPTACCYKWPAGDFDGDGVVDRLDRCGATPKGCTVDEFGCPSDEDGDGVCDGLDKCPGTPPRMKVNAQGCAQSQLAATPPPPAAPKEVERPAPPPPAAAPPVSEVERQLVEGGRIRLENVYFETASANLLPESAATLDEVGRALEKFPSLRIEVQGHTDTRGSAAYNLKLSQARAESVRSYLLDHFQLQPDNLMARGYGETEPETAEKNEEELLRNRRVVLKALNPDVLPRGVQVENKE